MASIKENIANNIIELRKKNKWTQVELGERLNYTDKTISKWERGESTPDAESLYLMSDIFEVPIDYFFKEHEEKNEPKKYRIPKNIFLYRLAQLCLISVSFWFLSTLIYVYLIISHKQILGSWIAFVWPVPATCLVTIILFRKIKFYEGIPYVASVFLWSLITVVYLTFLVQGSNIWLIFIIGIPIQLIIILREILIKNKKTLINKE